MSSLELIATTGFGLESIVARELQQLGYDDQTVEDGRVTFRGDETAICRANLWLRSAGRVLVKMGEFEARDFGLLFDQTKALPWSDWLPREAAFPVSGRSVRSQLTSVPDCQSIVKKAIVESLKQTHAAEWFDETGPQFAVEVALLRDRATITLDTSGSGLHRRGYRDLVGVSPLRETLAAGLVQLSHWNRDRPLFDPFCGSGTIAIEAALVGRNLAPGLTRQFAAEAWPRVPAKLWDEARDEARSLAMDDVPGPIVASDVDAKGLDLARRHAERAGVDGNIEFVQRSFDELDGRRKYGCLICNPPYGERSGDQQAAEDIYHRMPKAFRRLDTWSIYVLTSHPGFEQLFGRRADRRRKLFNGRIQCTYYQYSGPRPPWDRGSG